MPKRPWLRELVTRDVPGDGASRQKHTCVDRCVSRALASVRMILILNLHLHSLPLHSVINMPPRRRRRILHACEPMTSAQQMALARHCNDPLQWHVSGAVRVPVLADDTTSFKSVKMVGSVSAITLSNLANFGVAYGALRYPRGLKGRRMVPNGGVTGLTGSSWTNELVRRLRGVEWEQVAESNLCIRIAIPSDIVKWDLYAGSHEWNAQSVGPQKRHRFVDLIWSLC